MAPRREATCSSCRDVIPLHFPTFLVIAGAQDAKTLTSGRDRRAMVPLDGTSRVFPMCNACYKLFITANMCEEHFAFAVMVQGSYRHHHNNPCRCDACAEDARSALSSRTEREREA